MALITALRAPYRGSKRRVISLDGEERLSTSAAVVRALGIAEGDEVLEGDLWTSVADAEPAAARERALRLLGYREHGSRELHGKLLDDGYSEPTATRTVAALESMGLIDDSRFAANLARTLIEGRHQGRSRARRELLARALPEELVDEALDACCPAENEYDRALSLARSWARPGADPRKLAGRLMRRGYPASVSFRASAAATGEDEDLAPDGGF